MMKKLEHPTCKESLRELRLFSLEKAHGVLINVQKYLMDGIKENEDSVSLVVLSEIECEIQEI